MAINGWESFDGVNSATDLILGPFSAYNNNGGSFNTLVGPIITATNARRGVGKCLKLQTISSFSGGQNWNCVYWLSKNLPATISTAFAGVWWQSINRAQIVGFMGFYNAGTCQVYIQLDNSGNLKVYRGTPGFNTNSSTPTSGVLLGTCSGSYSTGTYYCIEMKVKVHGSTGTVDVQVNGTNVLALTGQNTSADSTTNITQVCLGVQCSIIEGGESSGNDMVIFDEFYYGDTTGSAPHNDMLGTSSNGGHRVTAKFPNATGTNHAFTPLSSTNVSQVSETAMDGATSYNSSSNNGDVDTFTKPALGANPVTIFGVQVKTAVALDVSGADTMSHAVLSGGTLGLGPAFASNTTYSYHNGQFLTDPATSAAWTVSGLDAAEFGYKRVT